MIMNEPSLESSTTLTETEAQEIVRSLLHKEGNWVDWGKKCQQLQQAGYKTQDIFEQTGFQAVQQNQIIVAAQVYDSLVKSEASPDLLNYAVGPKADILYEFRLLNQEQRLAAVQIAQDKRLDVDGAKEIARAIKEFAQLSQAPIGFTNHPGDAVAYQAWKRARQKKDLQERSRLIAHGLKFAHSASARSEIEKLLSDFTTISVQNAPLLPLYRFEAEEELPQIVPVAGTLPLTKAQIDQVTPLTAEDPFGIVSINQSSQIVALPGWQILLKAVDPVAIFLQSDQLPQELPGKSELVLMVVDRHLQQWNLNNYFLVEQEGQLTCQWFAEQPSIPLIGQVVLVLRPKKILDENNLLEPWQMDD